MAALLPGCATRDAPQSPRPIAMPIVLLEPKAPGTPANSQILTSALQQLERGDSAGAMSGIAGIRDPVERANVAAEFIRTVAERSPAVAASLLPHWQLGRSRSADIELVAGKFARAEPEAALRWAATLDEPATASIARRIVAAEMAVTNGREAVGRINALPDGEAKEMLAGFAAAAWARQEPAAAEAWALALPDGARRQRLLSSVAFEVAQTDPKRAIALAESLPAGRDRWLLLAASSQTWVAQDLPAAFAWANQLPPGEERDAALAGVNAGLGGGRARRVTGASGLRGSRGRAPVGGTGMATETGSPAFAAWLATQPHYLSPEDAAIEYVRQRANVEPLAIGQWVAGLPGGTTRERVIDAYLETSAPASAAQWLASLAGSDRTNERIERVAQQWLQTNPNAAATWLQGTSLPADRKEFLLRQAGR